MQKLFSWSSLTTLSVISLHVFHRKPGLPHLTVSAQILVWRSLLLGGKPVYRQRQKLFTWLSPTTLSITTEHVFHRKPDLPDLTVSAQISMWRYFYFSKDNLFTNKDKSCSMFQALQLFWLQLYTLSTENRAYQIWFLKKSWYNDIFTFNNKKKTCLPTKTKVV
jgi:hypothetical protein